MKWNDLVANGLILQLLGQRALRSSVNERGLNALQPQLADLREGRFVIDGEALGLAQPVMTLAPAARSGQWWWDSKAAVAGTTDVVDAVRSAGVGCAQIEQAVVSCADLWPGRAVEGASMMKVASCVAGACTALIDGPLFYPIDAGKAVLVIAVQTDDEVSMCYDDSAVDEAVSYASWVPIDSMKLHEAAISQIG